MVARANVLIGYNAAETQTSTQSELSLEHGSLDGMVDRMVVGFHGSGSGRSQGTFYMGAGSLSVNTIEMGTMTDTGNSYVFTSGSIALDGGSITVNDDIITGEGRGFISVVDGSLDVANGMVVTSLSSFLSCRSRKGLR